MLLLPAAALCCLCSAMVATAAEELIQDQLSLTRRVVQSASFTCEQTQRCDYDEVFWYQKKETFTLIMYIDRSDGAVEKGYGHPQKDDFSAVNIQNGCELKIDKVKLSHSASYYCSCLKLDPHISVTVGGWYHLIFGSGTKLYVTDEPVVKPVVSVYPAASRAHLEGKSSLLCLASAMSPPLVQFSWKRQKEDGPLEELPPAEGEQLQLTQLGRGRSAAILTIRQPENATYKYICSVRHEGGTAEGPTQQEVPAPAASCPPETEPAVLAAQQQADLLPLDPLQPQSRVKLLCLLYTVLIVKSLVYCCGLSLLMSLRDDGPSTNYTD
ncbi:immunoglobulin lambda-1 light chain-like [Echeneis naucrates]|uniref:immunoglobulin lambda-1 light chain-like n=1 Tax=Echeneis naucrates TaxID=173247 RepID=UPI0011138923|nr:immunoglobulin lambda-1 light chain-like [Echeneis naucrates]